ncbi:MAG: BrnT family toxin [SAR324 cluster bacterium]|nr:BrnT family toxin [SAR324 cluster bacterium]
MQFRWNSEKNLQLQQTRNISFEKIVFAIENGGLIDIVPHPNKDKYPNQLVYVVNIEQYIHLVPFVKENPDIRFLKTIIPSRKATKKYIPNRVHEI